MLDRITCSGANRHRRPAVCTLTVLTILMLCVPLTTQAQTFRGNVAHTRGVRWCAPETVPRLKWTFHTHGEILSSAAVEGAVSTSAVPTAISTPSML